MAICATCRTIDLKRMVDLYRYSHFDPEARKKVAVGFPHHKTYAALRKSVADGCGSCAQLFAETNADPKYPNKPGIGEEDAVMLYIISGDGNWRKLIIGTRRDEVVVTGLEVS